MATAQRPATILTINEAAETLGCSVDAVRRWARKKKIASTKVGMQYRFSDADIDEFLQRGRNDFDEDPEQDSK